MVYVVYSSRYSVVYNTWINNSTYCLLLVQSQIYKKDEKERRAESTKIITAYLNNPRTDPNTLLDVVKAHFDIISVIIMSLKLNSY